MSVDLLKGRYPDADVWICEHIHTSFTIPLKIESFNGKGEIEYKNKWYVQAPTLKEEFKGKKRGYVHAKVYEATPIGVVLLEFACNRESMEVLQPRYELM